MHRCFVQSLDLITSVSTYSEGRYANNCVQSQSKVGVTLVMTLFKMVDVSVTRLVNDDMRFDAGAH